MTERDKTDKTGKDSPSVEAEWEEISAEEAAAEQASDTPKKPGRKKKFRAEKKADKDISAVASASAEEGKEEKEEKPKEPGSELAIPVEHNGLADAKELFKKKKKELARWLSPRADQTRDTVKKKQAELKKKAGELSVEMAPHLEKAKQDARKGYLVAKDMFEEKIVDRYVRGTALEPYVNKVDTFAAFMTRADYEVENEAIEVARGPIKFGMWVFLLVFVFLGGWSACAQLDSAAVAQGTVVLDANKKTIQHLEGGIIAEILVRDGDFVKAGDPLIRLSDTNARARQDILLGQLRTALATEGRLLAERDEAEMIQFDERLLAEQDVPQVKQIMDAEVRLFETRRLAYQGRIKVLRQRIGQFGDEIDGLKAQVKSTREQLALIEEETESVRELVEKGLSQKPRLLALQRKTAELGGNRGEDLALIARAKQNIAEAELEIINLKNETLGETVSRLREIQDSIADIKERLKASEDILQRIVIVAPQAGLVTGMQYHTIGGVIQPGAKIMDIVPQDDELIIEAHVKPQDIDIVHAGLLAQVRLTAFKTRTVPMLKGEVTQVSADRFIDEVTGVPYYLARIKIDQEMKARLVEEVELKPGMPADVLIVTGEKTPLSYLFDPITDSFHKAFREE